jgi:hypothetical protein
MLLLRESSILIFRHTFNYTSLYDVGVHKVNTVMVRSCLSVRHSAFITSDTTQRILINFNIWFYIKSWMSFWFVLV